MRSRKLRRIVAVFMTAFILFWSVFPAISMAFFITPGTPIKPGEAITPGEAIRPGQPISGGQFIIPGEVFQPGNAIQGGKPYQPGSIYQGGNAPVSGQPIIPGTHIQIGQFIIPNITGSLPINSNWLVTGEAISGGESITPGNNFSNGEAISGGNTINGGTGSNGGTGPGGGTGPDGGSGPGGVNGPNGGTGPDGVNGPNGGTGPSGVNGPNGGTGPDGVNGPNGGTGTGGVNGPNGGTGPGGVNGPNGGTGPDGVNGPNGGTGPSGVNGPNGGTGPGGVNGPNGGTGPGGVNGPNGGTGPDGVNGPNGGTGPGGVNGPNGGTDPGGGTGPDGGSGPGGVNGSNGGTGPGNTPTGSNGPTGGDATSNGDINGGNTSEGGNNSSGNGSGSGESISGSNGSGTSEETKLGNYIQNAFTLLNNTKKAFVTIPTYLGQILDGGMSVAAGFKITDLKTASGNKNLYRVDGKGIPATGRNNLSTWLNMRYSNYLNSFENSKDVIVARTAGSVAVIDRNGNKTTRNYAIFQPRSGSEIKQKHIQGFLDEMPSFKSVFKQTGDYMKKNWIPIENKKFNKSFFTDSSVLAKGNGVANVLLTVGSRFAQNMADPTRTWTDFTAGVTTDVLLGAGQTAVSVGAGWGASVLTAATFGSVFPGVGTAAGALAGLGIALIMSTNAGKNFSRKVESIVKSGIEKVKNSKFAKGFVKGFKGLFGG